MFIRNRKEPLRFFDSVPEGLRLRIKAIFEMSREDFQDQISLTKSKLIETSSPICVSDEPKISDFSATPEQEETIEKERLSVLERDIPSVISRTLGFRDYAHYLRSLLWERIKVRINERDKKVCRRCGGKADQIHHLDYTLQIMRGDDDSQLVSLCDGCHYEVHYDEHRKKRKKEDWIRLMLETDHRSDFPPVKIDRRRNRWKQLVPREWERMNAVQRSGWEKERNRQFDLWELHRNRGNRTAENLFRTCLHQQHAMDDCAINSELEQIQRLKRRK